MRDIPRPGQSRSSLALNPGYSLRVWSYNDAKAKYQTAGAQSKAAVQAALDHHQGRKG